MSETRLEKLAKTHSISLKSWPDGNGGVSWSLMVDGYKRGKQVLSHDEGTLTETIDSVEKQLVALQEGIA
jgi:hypothetical protein